MELKRILARDSRSANEKAIQLYGPEALIISTQRVDQQTELIVAVDVGVQETGSAKSAQAMPVSQHAEGFVSFSKVFENVQAPESLPMASQPAADLLADFDVPVFQAQLSDEVPDPKPAPPVSLASAVTVHNAVGSEPVLAVPAVPYEQQRSQEIVALLRQEMAALRKEFALSRHMQPWQQTLGLSAQMQQLTAL
jgi:flagellar biosynthesis GTPase FlhF